MTQLALPIHSYELRSRPASPSRLVNCYPEQLPPDGKVPVLLTRAPGIKDWTTVGSGPIRGMYSAHIELTTGHVEYLYVVSGSELYYVDSAKSSTLIGDVGDGGRIDLDSNLNYVVVVNEPLAYSWDGATFSQILDEDFVSRGAGDVEFLDDFMIFREPNSARFFIAEYGTTSVFDALQFAIADSSTDDMVGMLEDHRQLLLFGTKSLEIWENTGSPGVPFERNINGVIPKGCLNPATIAVVDYSPHWVAEDFTVRRLDGLTPMRVSTHPIEQKISAATASTAQAFAYDQEGHFFYVLTLNEGTYVLDVTTGQWHERQTYGRENWKPRFHAQFTGAELVGDSDSNKIGEIDPDTYDDWGSTQRMEWTYQPIYALGQRAFHNRFEIILETGVGLTAGQGSAPKIMLQYSDDGGETWKSMPDKSLGALGKRETRAVWYNLGSSRQRVYRAAVSDPIQVTITDTIAEVDGGRL